MKKMFVRLKVDKLQEQKQIHSAGIMRENLEQIDLQALLWPIHQQNM